MPPTTEIIDVSPDIARTFLEANTCNRDLRPSIVNQYAQEMKHGRWMLNHQGIAFDDFGALIDGQHRLTAILQSGATVPLMVTRGLAVSQKNGIEVFTMDTIDRGPRRTTGDQLRVRHGIRNGAVVSRVLARIASICTRQRIASLSMTQALEVLKLYKDGVEHVMQHRSTIRALNRPSVLAAVAFAMSVEFEALQPFYAKLISGENLTALNPVCVLRNHLLQCHTTLGLDNMTLNAARAFLASEDVDRIKNTAAGLNYFVSLQKDNVTAIRTLFPKE